MLLSEKVRRGEFVAIAGDRIPVSSNPRVAMAKFLGEIAPFPVGPYILASLLRCPVYLLFSLRTGDTSEIHFELFRESIRLPARGGMKYSVDSWGNMPVGSSISACGRHCNGSIFTIFGIYPRWTHLMHPADLKNPTSARTIEFDNGRLKIEDIVDIAEGSASVSIVRCY